MRRLRERLKSLFLHGCRSEIAVRTVKRFRGWMCTGYELGDVIPQWQRRRETISPVQPATSSRKWRLLATSLCTGSLWKRGKLFNFIFFSSIHDSSVSCPGILLRDSLVTWALASFHNNRPRRLRQSNNRDCALSKFRKWQDTLKVAWNQLQVTWRGWPSFRRFFLRIIEGIYLFSKPKSYILFLSFFCFRNVGP